MKIIENQASRQRWKERYRECCFMSSQVAKILDWLSRVLWSVSCVAPSLQACFLVVRHLSLCLISDLVSLCLAWGLFVLENPGALLPPVLLPRDLFIGFTCSRLMPLFLLLVFLPGFVISLSQSLPVMFSTYFLIFLSRGPCAELLVRFLQDVGLCGADLLLLLGGLDMFVRVVFGTFPRYSVWISSHDASQSRPRVES